jgi:hypothetical protein
VAEPRSHLGSNLDGLAESIIADNENFRNPVFIGQKIACAQNVCLIIAASQPCDFSVICTTNRHLCIQLATTNMYWQKPRKTPTNATVNSYLCISSSPFLQDGQLSSSNRPKSICNFAPSDDRQSSSNRPKSICNFAPSIFCKTPDSLHRIGPSLFVILRLAFFTRRPTVFIESAQVYF